jgi:membrane protein implicated in regulation of membrane protease activity
VPNSYVGRIFVADGWTIAGGVLTLLGGIFGLVGLILTLTLVTAFAGLPFAGLGALLLVIGVPVLIWRYTEARNMVEVLRTGDAVRGEIVEVYQSFHVQINGRHPWTVVYRFQADGQEYGGKVTTLSRPDLSRQPGRPVYVIHARRAPQQNTIYPRLYGYYGV